MGEDVSAITRLQGYQSELRVNEEEAHPMRGFACACRLVFNRPLAFEKEIFDLCGFRPGYADLSEQMASWKEEPETSWLKAAPSQALQQSLKNLKDGRERHFESLEKLKAGKINPNQASRTARVQERGAAQQAFASRKDLNSIRKTVRSETRLDPLPQQPGGPRVRRKASPSGKQLADGSRSILTEREVKKPVHPSTSAAGIAMGMVRLATLSTGKFIEPHNSFKKHQDRLLKVQAAFEPQAEVEQELEEGASQGPAHVRPHRQRSSGLSAEGFLRHQQEPRDGCCRTPAGQQHVPICGWHC
jgi:putative transposase